MKDNKRLDTASYPNYLVSSSATPSFCSPIPSSNSQLDRLWILEIPTVIETQETVSKPKKV